MVLCQEKLNNMQLSEKGHRWQEWMLDRVFLFCLTALTPVVYMILYIDTHSHIHTESKHAVSSFPINKSTEYNDNYRMM